MIIHRSMNHSPGTQNRGLKTIHLSVHPSLITVSLRAGFTLTVTRSLYISRNVAADCSSLINPGFTYPRKILDWSPMAHILSCFRGRRVLSMASMGKASSLPSRISFQMEEAS